MLIPSRFETYRGFVITPQPVEIHEPSGRHARWSIGGSIRREGDSESAEEDFHDKGRFAASHDEAIEKAIAFAEQLIDARATK
jgi:hypothetical protein